MRYFFLFSLMILTLMVGSNCSGPAHTKVYHVAYDPTWYPQDLMGNGASIQGFSDDLLKEIGKRQGLVIQLYSVGWDSLLSSVNQGKADAALSSVLPILQYQDMYSFSQPYLLLGPVLVVRSDFNASSLNDVSGKEVGLLHGSPYILLVEKNPNILIRYFDKFPQALEELVNHTIDGVIMPSLLANAYVKDLYRGILKIGSKPLTEEGLRMLTLKGQNEALIKGFNEGLDKLLKDGTYDQLLMKWNLK